MARAPPAARQALRLGRQTHHRWPHAHVPQPAPRRPLRMPLRPHHCGVGRARTTPYQTGADTTAAPGHGCREHQRCTYSAWTCGSWERCNKHSTRGHGTAGLRPRTSFLSSGACTARQAPAARLLQLGRCAARQRRCAGSVTQRAPRGPGAHLLRLSCTAQALHSLKHAHAIPTAPSCVACSGLGGSRRCVRAWPRCVLSEQPHSRPARSCSLPALPGRRTQRRIIKYSTPFAHSSPGPRAQYQFAAWLPTRQQAPACSQAVTPRSSPAPRGCRLQKHCGQLAPPQRHSIP
jgi:hypothetical protein